MDLNTLIRNVLKDTYKVKDINHYTRHVMDNLLQYFNAKSILYIMQNENLNGFEIKEEVGKNYEYSFDKLLKLHEINALLENCFYNGRTEPVENNSVYGAGNIYGFISLLPVLFKGEGGVFVTGCLLVIHNVHISIECDFTDILSGFFTLKTINRYELIWNKVFYNIRKSGRYSIISNDEQEDNVYKKILEALKPLYLVYATILLYSNEENIQCFVKQEDLFYRDFEKNNYRKYKFDFNAEVVVNLSNENHLNSIISHLYVKYWKDIDGKYLDGTKIEGFVRPVVINKNDFLSSYGYLFINKMLDQINNVYIVFIPVIKVSRDTNPDSKDRIINLKGILVLFLHNNFNEISLFNAERAKKLSSIIDSTITESVKTTQQQLFKEISNIVPYLGQSHEIYGEKLTKLLCKNFNADYASVFLSETKTAYFDVIYSNEKNTDDNLISLKKDKAKRFFKDFLERFRYEKYDREAYRDTGFFNLYNYYKEGGLSEIYVGIRGTEQNKGRGIINIVNKKSSIINDKIVPFRQEDIELASYIGRIIAIYYESHIYMFRIKRYFNVIPHEINTSAGIIKALIYKRFYKFAGEELVGKTIESINAQLNIIFRIKDNAMIFVNDNYTIKKSEFFVYGNIFFTWRAALSSKFGKRHKRLISPEDYNENVRNTGKMLADRTLIEQLIYNLLTNALKYSYEGTNVYFEYYIEGDFYIINIKDYGYRFSSESTHDLFQAGVQGEAAKFTGETGLGMGLHIIDKIIKWHNGSIEPVCEEIFFLNLPVAYYMDRDGMLESRLGAGGYEKFKDFKGKNRETLELIVNCDINRVDEFLINNEYLLNYKTYIKEFTIRIPIDGGKRRNE